MFLKNNKYGSKSKRGKGRTDKELKTQLRNLTKEILDSINVDELTKTQKITFLKSSLAYLLPKEYVNDTYINEDVPLFVDEPPVVIAFNDSKEREQYQNATEQEQKEMEKTLRVDIFNNKGFNA